MINNFFNHINLKRENINIPNGMAENIEEECIEYEKRICKLKGLIFKF